MPSVNLARSYTNVTGAVSVYPVNMGGPPGSKTIPLKMADNQQHVFYIFDGVNFESFLGRYNSASGGTVTVLTRYETSNGVNDPVVWTSGQQIIEATSRSQDYITDDERTNIIVFAKTMARALAHIPAGQDIIVAGSGQSYFGAFSHTVTDSLLLTVNTLWEDWSSDGVGGAKDWRTVNLAHNYTDFDVATAIYTGVPRTQNLNGTMRNATHWGAAFCSYLAFYMQRKVKSVFTARPGTFINDAAYGWTYSPGSGNTADQHAIQFQAAMTRMAVLDPTQTTTKAHIYLFSQGQADAAQPKSSTNYGFLLSQHVAALERNDRWAMCDENTIYFLAELGPRWNGRYPKFRGMQVARALIGSRASIVSMEGAEPVDPSHITSKSQAQIGKRLAQFVAGVSGIVPQTDADECWRYSRVMNAINYPYTLLAPSDSVEPITSQVIFTTDYAYISLSMTTGSDNLSAIGLDKFAEGKRLVISKVGSETTNYKIATLTSGSEVAGSYPYFYWYWTCTVEHFGTIAANSAVTLTSDWLAWDQVSVEAQTDLPIRSSVYASASDVMNLVAPSRKLMVADKSTGRLYRSPVIEPYYNKAMSANATGNLIGTWIPEDGTYGMIDLNVTGVDTASGNQYWFVLSAEYKKVSGVTTVLQLEVNVKRNPTSIGTPYLATLVTSNVIWFVVNGHSATNIWWQLQGNVFVTPTS